MIIIVVVIEEGGGWIGMVIILDFYGILASMLNGLSSLCFKIVIVGSLDNGMLVHDQQ